MAQGDELEVEAIDLVAGGDAIARVDGFPLFVQGLYPGDHARVRITEVKRGFARGEGIELLQRSPLRRDVPCPIADRCGGCDWTSLRLDAQLRAKRKILLDSLGRVGKLDVATLPQVHVHPSPLNYRIRSRLHRDRAGELGFFARSSHQVVPLTEECEVVGPQVIRHLENLRAGRGEGAIETFEDGTSFTTCESGEAEGKEVSIRVGSFHYELSTAAFFQVNRHLLPVMLELLTGHASTVTRTGLAFDLYAGVGFFTLPLAAMFKHVFSVESASVSHRYAKKNLERQANVTLGNETAEDFLVTAPRDVDFIMVDPPRAGMSTAVLEGVSSRDAEMICYLSCDPVTLARDAARLVARGWALASLDLLDLFPNTHHIETLSSFTRERRTRS